MKNQALFSSKDKSKNLKCRLLQFLFGALRVYISHVLIAAEQELNSMGTAYATITFIDGKYQKKIISDHIRKSVISQVLLGQYQYLKIQ